MSDGRVQQFRADIAEMRIKGPVTRRDAFGLRLGVGLVVVGVAMTILSSLSSRATTIDLNQRDDIVTALAGTAATVVGGALFLRYSLGKFLRFWLSRLIYEQRAQTDRLLTSHRTANNGLRRG